MTLKDVDLPGRIRQAGGATLKEAGEFFGAMSHYSRFVIENDASVTLVVNVEPECVQVSLAAGEKVTVRDAFETEPVTLKVESDKGETIISIWPGDGEVRVEKNGVDVFELAEKDDRG